MLDQGDKLSIYQLWRRLVRFQSTTPRWPLGYAGERHLLTAIRSFEELEAPKIGAEDNRVVRAALELVEDEQEPSRMSTAGA